MRSSEKHFSLKVGHRKNPEPLWIRISVVALVALCLFLGGLLWWQLLSGLPSVSIPPTEW